MLYDKINFAVHPIYFDQLPEKQQLDLITNYTIAAKQGIRELNENRRGDNTIVHDIIHLHSDKLFRIIFESGSPFLNIPNSRGSTPLLEAVSADDEALVILMLEGMNESDISESINCPNSAGITPLFAAVSNANPKLVELLLKNGAAFSVKMLDQRGLSPLHVAATLKDPFFVEILLKYGAKEMINKFTRGTPLQHALMSGRVAAVRLMLDADPELAMVLNQPDLFKVTPIHRAVRSGNMEMVELLLERAGLMTADLVEKQILVNKAASFTSEDLEACLVLHSKDYLEKISIENVAFPLTIAQNNCNVMVRLKDGKILRIPNGDAEQVRAALIDKKFGPGMAQKEGLNRLTFYLNEGHGFLRLECTNCDRNKPYNKNRGFYPTERLLQSNALEKMDDSLLHRIKVGARSLTKNSLGASGKLLNNRFAQKGSLFSTAGRSVISLVKNLDTMLAHPFLTTFGSSLGVPTSLGATSSFIGSKRYSLMTDEFIGMVVDEDRDERSSDFANSLKITFYINDLQAKAALDTLNEVKQSCVENPRAACRFQAFEHNCIDFLQDVFESAEGAGDFASYFNDNQLGSGISYLAHNYAFARSRKVNLYKHFIIPQVSHLNRDQIVEIGQAFTGSVIPDSASSKALYDRNQTQVKDYSHALQQERTEFCSENASHAVSSNQVYLGDSLLLGLVLGKVAINTYHFVSGLWGKVVGEKATLEMFSKWHENQSNQLEYFIQQLDLIGRKIDRSIERLENDIEQIKNGDRLYNFGEKAMLEALQGERSQRIKLRNDHIDLLFEAVKLEDELSLLKRMGGLPTKSHLEDLQARMMTLSSQIAVMLCQTINT